jgi:hypothetical protein
VCLLGTLWRKGDRSSIGSSGDRPSMVPDNSLDPLGGLLGSNSAMQRASPQFAATDAVVCLLGTLSFAEWLAPSPIDSELRLSADAERIANLQAICRALNLHGGGPKFNSLTDAVVCLLGTLSFAKPRARSAIESELSALR